MPKTPSTLGLHLRYRIWIAEMNADITTLRIFDDYLAELAPGKKEAPIKNAVEEFKKQFNTLRKELDDLKHEMHLQKMKLAACTREGKPMDKKLYKTDNHAALKNHYTRFRKTFSKMKTGLGLISNNWAG